MAVVWWSCSHIALEAAIELKVLEMLGCREIFREREFEFEIFRARSMMVRERERERHT